MTYFNQSLTWQHVSSINDYNESTYTTTTIKGRKEGINKLVNNKSGQVATSNTRVYTLSAVEVNDLIDDRQVLRVDAVWGFDQFSHYEVYLA
jgi:hypothetical protein